MLSIIVPIYKIEDYLPQCIDSILSQTFRDFELILVDDGSPDRCPIICDNYAEKDNRIRVIHKANGGLVSARKAGLRTANGDYVGYVDGDDWIDPGFYEKLMEAAFDTDADIVASGFIKDIGDNFSVKRNALTCGRYSKKQISTEILPKMMFDDNYFEPGMFTYVWNKVFKKDVLYSAQMNVPENISLGEDAACVYPAMLKAEKVCVINDCLYHYRQRADSMLKVSENYHDDYCGYKLLHSYLNACFDDISVLKKELDKFILYLITTRCGGIYIRDDKLDWYLYDKKPRGNKIAVYGAGTLGQHLVRRLNMLCGFNIVKWVDEDFEILRDHGLAVDSPSSAECSEYDNILIAFLNQNTAEKTKDSLLRYGALEENIIMPNFLSINFQKALGDFGVI